MIGLAARPGTAVEPMWSTRTAPSRSASAMRVISAAPRAAQSASYSTIRIAGSNRSSSEGCRCKRAALGGFVAGALGFAELAEGALALVARGPVQDQDAVQVVYLVLDHAGLEARGLDEARAALLVECAYAHVHGALDVDGDAGD